MNKLRSRYSATNISSYVSNVFIDGAKFSRPIKEQTSGSIEIISEEVKDSPVEVKQVEEVIVAVKKIEHEPKNETLGEIVGLPIGEEGQIPEVEGPGEQEISIVPNKEVSGSLVEGSEVLGSKAGKQPKGE